MSIGHFRSAKPESPHRRTLERPAPSARRLSPGLPCSSPWVLRNASSIVSIKTRETPLRFAPGRSAGKVARIVRRLAGCTTNGLTRSTPPSDHRPWCGPTRAGRTHHAGYAVEDEEASGPRSAEVRVSRLPEARVESGNREDAVPLAPFGETGAADE